MFQFHRITSVLCALALGSLAATADDRRIYMIGNSLTDDILYDGFKQIVNQQSDSVALGSMRIPGATIQWLWNNPDGFTHSPFGPYSNAFANHTWDALTLQPFSGYSGELQFARYFAQALRGNGTFGPGVPGPGVPTGASPDAAVYMYAQWPNNLLAGWDPAVWLLPDHNVQATQAYYEKFVEELTVLEPDTVFRLIPVGHVFHELHYQAKAGKIPGITRMADWLDDARHLNDRGGYVAAMTYYATIYRKDPRGRAPVPFYPITAEQALAVQDAVWKVVSNHPMTGVPQSLVITSPSLPDARVGSAYSAPLEADLAAGSVSWSLSEGNLPTGITLSSAGVISGTTAEPGFYEFTAKAVDAGNFEAKRSYILSVISNNPPKILTATLPQARVGTPYRVVLQSEGGFGSMSWTIASGDLPRGLTLTPDGIISGIPTSVSGMYRLMIELTDDVPSVSAISYAFILGQPEDGTLTVAPVPTPPTVDGNLQESLWASLHPLTRVVSPGVDPAAGFGIRWDADAIYIGVKVPDSDLQQNGDRIHILMDGLHDRQAVFNADDRHLVIKPDGNWTEMNTRTNGISVAVTSDGSGWAAEARIPFSNLERPIDGQSLSIGFDVAVVDADASGAPGVSTWWKSDPGNPTPALMGNVVLSKAPISQSILVNGDFSNRAQIQSFPYPSRARPDMAGIGWVWSGIGSRTLSSLDGTGYGFPDVALQSYGSSNSSIYQVLNDAKATKGSGYLRFDARDVTGAISYRLFGYNGDATNVQTRMGVEIQQHPNQGGQPDATLLSGTLAEVPANGTWREVALPVNFGQGYDYLILAFSGGSNIPIKSRMDNIHLGVPSSVTLASGNGMLGETPVTLVAVDFKGTNPSASNPWTPATVRHPAITYGGLHRGAGITAATGNDRYYFSQNSGSTRGTLARSIERNQYLELRLTAPEGTSMDLGGGLIQFSVNRQGQDASVRFFSVFTSVNGFSEAAAIGTTKLVSTTGLQTYAMLVPETPAYRGLTDFRVRLLGFDGQYENRTITLESFAVSGVAHVTSALEQSYNEWRNSINWGGAASGMKDDPNGNGLSNFAEMAMDLPDPAGSGGQHFLPVMSMGGAPGAAVGQLTHRRTTRDAGLEFLLQTSVSLTHWTTQPVAGSGLIEELLEADPDGDGSAQLWRFTLPLEQFGFMRLLIRSAE